MTRIAKLDVTCNYIKEYTSHIKYNDRGVPQGSILGPLLFLIYVNDLPRAISERCVLFADDTTLMFRCNNSNDIKSYELRINNALQDITNWLNVNNLQINTKKSNFIQFSNSRAKKVNLTVHCNAQKIEQVESVKFLGTCIDQNLSWKHHIETLCNKLHSLVFALRIIRNTISVETSITVYHAYVCSVLRYGIILWGNSPNVQAVFVAQKKCIRAIWRLGNTDSCRPLFLKYKLLTLPSIYIYEISKFVKYNLSLFEIKNNENKRPLTHLPLNMPRPRLKIYQQNCYYMGSLIFNSIPAEISALPQNTFCRTLRQWLNEQCFYSVHDFLQKSHCRFNKY